MFHPVDSPPNPCLSLSSQTCQLTSPALMSQRAASCSRKLLSGKDTSALGMQLWLAVGRKKTKQNTSAGFLLAATPAGDVTCTHTSSEAERVPSPRSSGSLPSLQGQADASNLFCQESVAALGLFFSFFIFFLMQQLKRRASGFGVTNAHNERRWLAQCDQCKSAQQ